MLIDIGDSGSLLFRHISIEQVFSYNFNLLLLSMILHLINEMPSLTVVTLWYTTTGRRTLGSPTQPAPPLLPTQRAHSRAVHACWQEWGNNYLRYATSLPMPMSAFVNNVERHLYL
jgi:hypothetical protein